MRRGGRVAEGARLERVWARKGLVGSNPTLSAKCSFIARLTAPAPQRHDVLKSAF
jgi:hypothetical protein